MNVEEHLYTSYYVCYLQIAKIPTSPTSSSWMFRDAFGLLPVQISDNAFLKEYGHTLMLGELLKVFLKVEESLFHFSSDYPLLRKEYNIMKVFSSRPSALRKPVTEKEIIYTDEKEYFDNLSLEDETFKKITARRAGLQKNRG